MIKVLWRISNHTDLSGIGGTITAGRWHHKGQPVVYLADSPATALLEVLVNFEMSIDELPDRFTLLRVELPPTTSEASIYNDLPEIWHQQQHLTRSLGTNWLNESSSLLLKVPTVIVPHNCNYLFNPRHPEASLAALSVEQFPLDSRLMS
ncbi:RES family NAD+ phosphorylase [Halomonas sediminis]